MIYTKEEVMEYVSEEDVAFIRLAFCDITGKQKNISIMAGELDRAFDKGIAFDPSSIEGFGNITNSDLVLHPDPSTLMLLPWRPERGKVVRMYCSITYADGSPFECDSRTLLANAVKEAADKGLEFSFGSEQEFYLFKLDEDGNPTKDPYDFAGDMDIAPEDKGENIRREICLTLDQMGIKPESSHHEEGPGQNEIDFKYADALSTADNVMTFQTIVKSVSGRNGLHADFSAKPLSDYPGNGFHINVSIDKNYTDEAFEGMTVTGEQELIYATAVAGDLRDNCYRLYASWNPDAEAKYTDRIDEIEAEIEINGKIYGANMLGAAALGSSFETWEEVLSTILVGGCSNICAEVADVKMGNAHTGEDVNYIESPYSEKSFQDFIDNILSIQYSLYGALGASNPGAKSIYTLLGNLGYSDVNKIQTALKGAIDALKTCQGKGAFVKIYADACVQDAMDAVSALDDELNKAASWIVRQ